MQQANIKLLYQKTSNVLKQSCNDTTKIEEIFTFEMEEAFFDFEYQKEILMFIISNRSKIINSRISNYLNNIRNINQLKEEYIQNLINKIEITNTLEQNALLIFNQQKPTYITNEEINNYKNYLLGLTDKKTYVKKNKK